MKILQKTVIGDLAASNEQRTIISAFGINILERRRVLLGTANISGGGGTAELQSIKNYFYLFKIPFFSNIQTFIAQRHALGVVSDDSDFCNIGKYAIETNNLEDQTLKLCANLPEEDQQFVIRQIALSKTARQTKKFYIPALTEKEFSDRIRLEKEFFPNIFKISEHLSFYKNYFLPINHFEASVFFYKHNLPEMFPPKVLDKIRQKDIIDVGGFIGDSAIVFEREFCDKNIYSFEPTQKNFALMQKTLALNHSKRIIPIKKGLGQKNETQTVSCAGSGSSILFNMSKEKESIEITTLDDFVAEKNVEIGFIKVDTEGFEQPFLVGAKQTICTQKPALLISIYHSGDDYFNIKPLIESWNLGYQMRIYKGTDFSLSVETALYCYLPD